jgi:hypothetical protein
LHRVRACLDEQIEVEQTGQGRIKVRGLTASTERKQEILEALHSIPLVMSSLQTIAEALRSTSSSSRAVDSRPQTKENFESIPPVTVHDERLPIEDQLQQYFIEQGNLEPGSSHDPRQVNLKIAALAKEAVSLSRSALSEAWALRRLAEKFDSAKTGPLKMQSRWLLEVMIRDHLAALLETHSTTRRLLEPVLSALPASRLVPTETESAPVDLPTPSGNSAWASKVILLFVDVERMDGLIHGLFANARLPGSQEEAAVSRLLSSFDTLEGRWHGLELTMGREFSGSPNSQLSRERSE